MTHIGGDRYMIIERDDFQGPPTSATPPRQKKLYLFDLNEVNPVTGLLSKRLIVDLLDINDPDDIGGPLVGIAADKFSFPLQSVESLTPVDDFTLLVGLDNNYPGGNGRVAGHTRRYRDHHAEVQGSAANATSRALQGCIDRRAQRTRIQRAVAAVKADRAGVGGAVIRPNHHSKPCSRLRRSARAGRGFLAAIR